jgi:hypothetical protein
MVEIQKFSLSYDASEDRLAWDAEDKQGGTTRLWLTQRLCKAMVTAVVPMIKPAAQEVAREHESTMQSWQQAAAVADLGKAPPVRTHAQTLTGLVREVNINPSANGLVLSFQFGAEQPCVIGLNVVQLRQTLAVIYRLNVSAGWPLDIWPAWIAEPEAGSGDAIVN